MTLQQFNCVHFDTVLRGTGNEWYYFILFKATGITNQPWYFSMVNIIIIYINVRDAMFKKIALILLSFCKYFACNEMLFDSWYCENINK